MECLVIGWSKKSSRRGKDIDEDVDAYYDTMVGNWSVSAIGQRKYAACSPSSLSELPPDPDQGTFAED